MYLRRGGREVDLDDAAVVERRRVRLQREDEADAPVARAPVQLEHLPPESELRLGEPLTRILDMLKTLSYITRGDFTQPSRLILAATNGTDLSLDQSKISVVCCSRNWMITGRRGRL